MPLRFSQQHRKASARSRGMSIAPMPVIFPDNSAKYTECHQGSIEGSIEYENHKNNDLYKAVMNVVVQENSWVYLYYHVALHYNLFYLQSSIATCAPSCPQKYASFRFLCNETFINGKEKNRGLAFLRCPLRHL